MLEKTVVICIAIVFLISSIVHLRVLLTRDVDVPVAHFGRFLFIIIDFCMALWLIYNIKEKMSPSQFMGLMIVHAIASPGYINTLIGSTKK